MRLRSSWRIIWFWFMPGISIGGWFSACFCICCMNSASACRSSCIRRLDLLVRGAVLEGLGKLLLGVAQALLGSRKRAAVLQAQRHVPQLVDDAAQPGAGLVARKPMVCVTQSEIRDPVGEIAVRLHRQRVDRLQDVAAPPRILDQLAALLDDGLGDAAW